MGLEKEIDELKRRNTVIQQELEREKSSKSSLSQRLTPNASESVTMNASREVSMPQSPEHKYNELREKLDAKEEEFEASQEALGEIRHKMTQRENVLSTAVESVRNLNSKVPMFEEKIKRIEAENDRLLQIKREYEERFNADKIEKESSTQSTSTSDNPVIT